MQDDVTKGRCYDCCNAGEALYKYGGLVADHQLKPARFCDECRKKREEERNAGKAPRPVGIPADIPTAAWVDLPDVKIRIKPQAGGGEIVVKAKFRKPTIENYGDDDGGEVRFKLPDLPNWQPAGILFLSTPAIQRNMAAYALSSVKHSLRNLFEPNAEVL